MASMESDFLSLAVYTFPLKMASEQSESWQFHKSLVECNLQLLENGFSDVTFRVIHRTFHEEQVEEIPGLRLLLLARSPVFFAMFSENFAQQTEREIIDVDCIEPQAFKQLLRFVYTDEVELSASNVVNVLYASKHYEVSMLTWKCLKFLQEDMTVDAALAILQQVILFTGDFAVHLKEQALHQIQEEAPAAVASEAFLDLSEEALNAVLQLELKISNEVDVFRACIQWAERKCKQMNKPLEGTNLREMLGYNLQLICFHDMTINDFSEYVAPRGVLTSEENYDILSHLITKPVDIENLPIRTEPRYEPPPRCLLVPNCISQTVELHLIPTMLCCTVSKPFILRKIFVHAGYQNTFLLGYRNLTVTVAQNGETLHSFSGRHVITEKDEETPEHYAMDVADVRIEPGDLQLDIKLKLCTDALFHLAYQVNLSPAGTSQMADDYVTISFPPVPENSLYGIEYSPLEYSKPVTAKRSGRRLEYQPSI